MTSYGGPTAVRLSTSAPYALAAMVTSSALAMGGAIPRWFAPIGLATLAFALALAFFIRKGRAPIVWPAIVLGLLGLYCLFQAIPLPLTWLTKLSPHAADIWRRCLLPAGESVSAGSISLDPNASLVEALKWSSYGATFYIASVVGRSRGANAGLAVVFGSAVLIAFTTLAHAIFGATAVYGLYTPRHSYPSGIGPFLNPNNLAGYLNLGALVGIGLLTSRTRLTSRWLLAAGLVTTVAVSLRTGSRGGIAALALGVLVFGLWAGISRRAAIASPRILGAVLTALLALAGVFAFVGADQRFWSELLSENAEKLRMPLWTVPMIKDYPWFGVGRGAFESAFASYRPQAANTSFTHPENFLVQWVTEWGFPVAVVATGALIWSLAPVRRGASRSALIVGALCGVATLGLQNLADLGLELGAVGTAAAAVLGSIWGSVRPQQDGRPRRRSLAPWLLRLTLAFGIIAGAWALAGDARSIDEDRFIIRRSIARAESARSAAERDRVRGEIRRMLLRHPADYYFPLAGAFIARMSGTNPMPWIQRALERAPTVGRTHILLGEVLADRGLTNQGLMELRIGVTYEPAMAMLAAQIAIARTQDGEALLRAVPEGAAGVPMLDAIGAYLPTEAVARERIDAEALSRDETLIEPRRRRIEARFAALETHAALCSLETQCIRFLELQIVELERIVPAHTLGVRTKARLLARQGRAEEAADVLSAGCAAPTERPACLRLRAEIVAGLKRPADLDAAVEAYVDASCVDRKQCAAANDWVGSFRMGRGDTQQGVGALERAARDEPTAERLLRLADAAEKAGLTSTALDALRRLLAVRGKDAAIEARIAALQRIER